MTATVGPVAESVFALDLFVRNNGIAFAGWRRQVRRRLGRRVAVVDQVARSCPVPSDLLRLLEQSAGGGRAGARPNAVAVRQVASAVVSTLSEFRRAAVVPYWGRIRSQLELERDARGRIVITKGVEHMLDTLHPRLRWKPPVLEIPDERQLDIHLDGSGLLLSPSLFLYDRPGVVVDAGRGGRPPTLAFPVPVTAAGVAALCSAAETNEQALSALVGHTRAAALQVLTDTCSTTELAQRLNISSAGASQHATVLRAAGLITTCRNRNTVLHAVTSLGMALLQSADPAPAAVSGHDG